MEGNIVLVEVRLQLVVSSRRNHLKAQSEVRAPCGMHSSRPHLCSPWCPVESEQVHYDRQPVLGHAQAHRALPTGEVNSSPAVNCLIHCSSASDLERPPLRGCSLLDPSPQPQPCQAELHQDPAGMHRESRVFRRGLGTPSSPEEPWESFGYICGKRGERLRCTWVQWGRQPAPHSALGEGFR